MKTAEQRLNILRKLPTKKLTMYLVWCFQSEYAEYLTEFCALVAVALGERDNEQEQTIRKGMDRRKRKAS